MLSGNIADCDVTVGWKSGGSTDPILLPFLSSSDEAKADDHLVELLAHLAMPIITGVVDDTLRYMEPPQMNCRVYQAQDKEDIVNEVILKILDRLRRLKESPESSPITNFQGYVAVAARNACSSYYRDRYPNRARFKEKLRYVLIHRREFALWNTADGESICGSSEWEGEQRPANSDWMDYARMQWEGHENCQNPDDLAILLQTIFAGTQAPIPFEDLLDGVAEILRITDDPPRDRHNNPAAAFPDLLETVAQRQFLERLWIEVQQLRGAQRTALLLSIRDETQTSLTGLLAEICITSVNEIANAAGMPVDEFVCVLDELPMDDNAIGKRLGVSRQQVISYRLSARRRLEKRLNFVGSQIRNIKKNRTATSNKR
jgi:RNA polymerase sigma factor (sigma-70 family)